ncbi:MAG: hypothetical protein E7Z72_05495 [Methanocorpusculum parvum]|nr:hypothetical protein [Methanocorpusculum parvum]
MSETPLQTPEKPTVQAAFLPKIDEEGAKALACSWIESQNISSRKQQYRIGRAVMIYYPFWEFIREDGSLTKTVYRPACGTLMTDLQKIQRTISPNEALPENLTTLPITVSAEYYYPEIHGIPRGERLAAVPFWLISYKINKSIYMLKIDAETGLVLPEWHPFKERVSWRKIAAVSFIPLVLISLVAVLLHPALFILDAAVVIFLVYQSRMFSLISSREDENGS